MEELCFCRRMMWAAGAVAAMSSITFPAVSALVSQSADSDKQGESVPSSHGPVRLVQGLNESTVLLCPSAGVVQGMITGIRGLCNGLGPALYGFIFFLFNVEFNTMDPIQEEYSIDPLPLHGPTEVRTQGFQQGLCSTGSEQLDTSSSRLVFFPENRLLLYANVSLL